MRKAFKPEDLESSLETIVDPYLKDNYPIEEVCKVRNTESLHSYFFIYPPILFSVNNFFFL